MRIHGCRLKRGALGVDSHHGHQVSADPLSKRNVTLKVLTYTKVNISHREDT